MHPQPSKGSAPTHILSELPQQLTVLTAVQPLAWIAPQPLLPPRVQDVPDPPTEGNDS